MTRKWKPSAAQRREFAERMQNPLEKIAYEARKQERADRRRSKSDFDYEKAGGQYVPTKNQHDFCFRNSELFVTTREREASDNVMYGYSCHEKVSHDDIHIVNEKIRVNNI